MKFHDSFLSGYVYSPIKIVYFLLSGLLFITDCSFKFFFPLTWLKVSRVCFGVTSTWITNMTKDVMALHRYVAGVSLEQGAWDSVNSLVYFQRSNLLRGELMRHPLNLILFSPHQTNDPHCTKPATVNVEFLDELNDVFDYYIADCQIDQKIAQRKIFCVYQTSFESRFSRLIVILSC